MDEQVVGRVLMTTDTVGGVWTFALDLASGLAGGGAEVILAAMGGQPTDEQKAAAARIPGLCLLGSDFRLEWMEDPWRDVDASAEWLSALQAEYAANLVHLNSFGYGDVRWNVPVVLTAHSCVLSWWRAVRDEEPPDSWNRYRSVVRNALHAADVVVAPSDAMSQTLIANYGVESSRLRTIYNGVHADKYHSGNKEPFVFAAGRLWDDAKNVSALARIAPELSWPVYVAGDTGAARFEACQMLGRLSPEQIVTWYSRASIYALPARYEPFGLSIAEAALSGCALVLGDIPSLREIWGDAALFAPPDNPNALRETIQTLIDNPTLRDRMAQRSHQRALLFDADQTTTRYQDLFRSVVASQNRQCVS